jgi:hypothetical protein
MKCQEFQAGNPELSVSRKIRTASRNFLGFITHKILRPSKSASSGQIHRGWGRAECGQFTEDGQIRRNVISKIHIENQALEWAGRAHWRYKTATDDSQVELKHVMTLIRQGHFDCAVIYRVSQKCMHILNAYNSHVNNDGILYFTGVGVECF